MKGIVKALIAGGIIICIGVVILVIALSMNGWKFKGNANFEMTAYECRSANVRLDVRVRTGTVKTEFYDGDKIIIEYPEADGFKTEISESDGTLIFKAPRKKWYEGWFLTYDIPDTVIRLPEGTAYDVKFNVDAGGAYLADGTYGSVEIDIDAGAFAAGNIDCRTLKINIDAGAVKLSSAKTDTFNCNIDAGALNVSRLDAQSSVIDVDAGGAVIGFAGAEADYTITRRVRAGQCNLNARTGGAKTINADISAGKLDAKFVG